METLPHRLCLVGSEMKRLSPLFSLGPLRCIPILLLSILVSMYDKSQCAWTPMFLIEERVFPKVNLARNHHSLNYFISGQDNGVQSQPWLGRLFPIYIFSDWAFFLIRQLSFIFCLQMGMGSSAIVLVYLAFGAQGLLYVLRFGVTRQEFPSSPNSKGGCLLTLLFIKACLERGDSPKNRPCASNTICNLGP